MPRDEWFSCSIAGAMISISSRPRAPDSPACGLRPATAIRAAAAPDEKGLEEPADPHDLGGPQFPGHVGERDMGGDESDGETRAGQEHGEVLHAAARGEEFGLAGKLEPDFIHASLVNRPGHDRVDLTRDRQPGGFLERGLGLARALGSGLA